jgi:hypothetical protein
MEAMLRKTKISRRIHSVFLITELAKVEPGQKESNLELMYRALVRKAISGDTAACKMIFDCLEEIAVQINEDESKEERQCTALVPSDYENLSLAEIQRLYMEQVNCPWPRQN